MKFFIETFGCKVNAYESNFISESLVNNGFISVSKISDADIIIINTCTVTNTADNKCFKYVRRVRRENPDCILIVLGCSVQNNYEKYEGLKIDILLGNNEKNKIVELINNYISSNTCYKNIIINRNKPFEDMVINDFNHTRAFIKIQDGCDNFCSYCIIPFVRGKCRSKEFNKIIKEAEYLVSNGHKEIVLTGIHTGSYNYEGKDLVDVINELSKIDNLKRIRLSSVEITELNDKFLDMLKNNNKFCNHLHVPLQAGSNEVLKMMNRKYDLDYFEKKINIIRSIRNNISITTDIIVGFPEETDEMFNSTMEFAKKISFSKIHVFPYSKRNGTVASKMKDIDNKIKKDRAHKLLELSNELERIYSQKFINKKVDVLIEEIINGKSIGHTSNYLKVIIDKELERGELYEVLYK